MSELAKGTSVDAVHTWLTAAKQEAGAHAAVADALAAPYALRVANRTATTLTLAWRPPKAAAALNAAGATYGALCVAAGDRCDAALLGIMPPPAPRAAAATITRLPAATSITCYAYTDMPVPKGAAKRVCSAAANDTTLLQAPALTQTYVSLTALGFAAYVPSAARAPGAVAGRWVPFAVASGRRRLAEVVEAPDPGVALTVKCVAFGGACGEPPTGTLSPLPDEAGRFLVADLAPLTQYTCFAVAPTARPRAPRPWPRSRACHRPCRVVRPSPQSLPPLLR